MSYTMEDFERDVRKREFAKLSLEEQRDLLRSLSPEKRRKLLESWPTEELLAGLPPEQRLTGLSPKQVQQCLDNLTTSQSAASPKPRRKK